MIDEHRPPGAAGEGARDGGPLAPYRVLDLTDRSGWLCGRILGDLGADLVAMAMSGLMSRVGEPGRPPLRVSLPQAAMWTGMHAAAGTLIAHHYREATGRGQQVDVSMQASLLWALANAPAHWSLL